MPAKALKAVNRKATAHEGAVSFSNTTFLQALIVPELAKACAYVLERDQEPPAPGYGLKQLRLLGEGGRAAVQKAVQTYTLDLEDSRALDISKLAAFLNSSQLLRLNIKIPSLPTELEALSSIQAATHIMAEQLSTFIASTSPALLNITHLDISQAIVRGSRERQAEIFKAFSAMLMPLAAACPQLQQLSVSGCVGNQFLKALGSSCPKLTHLEAVLPQLTSRHLSNLPTMLPRLTSLTARDSPTSTRSIQANIRNGVAIIAAVKACPSLRTLDIGSCAITEDIWLALPPDLDSLACSTATDIPSGEWPEHTRLRKLELADIHVEVSTLVSLLVAAPNVVVIGVSEKLFVHAALCRTHALELQYLNNRMCTGLVFVLSTDAKGRKAVEGKNWGPCTPTLLFRVHVGERDVTDTTLDDYEHTMPAFMAPAVMDASLPSFTVVEFTNEEGEQDEGECADLSHLPRVFPNVQHLSVNNMDVEPGAAVAPLVACESLVTLKFETVDGFSGTDLRLLCSEAKVLRSVYLCQCRGISVKEEERIYEEGGKLSGVSLEIDRGDMLYDEDDRHDRLAERWIEYTDEDEGSDEGGSDEDGSDEDDPDKDSPDKGSPDKDGSDEDSSDEDSDSD